jgi:hypothetical protein
MFLLLQVITVALVAVAMALSLAHALEFPGKLRLDRETYLAVQTIYYPGFTFGGLGEGLGMVATLLLLILTPAGTPPFWWILVALVALVAMHATYWIVTHPVNKFWLKDQALGDAGRGFFRLNPAHRSGPSERDGAVAWTQARDRWEYSHVARAIFAAIAFLALIVAVAI